MMLVFPMAPRAKLHAGVFLFPNDFDQNPFLATPIKLAIKDLFPCTEIQFSIGDCHHNFTTHHLALHVRIRVIFSSTVVAVP